MWDRLTLALGLVLLATAAAPAQQTEPVVQPQLCRTAATDKIEELEPRREALEREIAGARGEMETSAHQRKSENAKLRKKREELLELVYRIECARTVRRTRAIAVAAGEGQVVEVTTYYATNRNLAGGAEPAKVYGAEVEGKFQYGRAVVTIPPTHTPGNLELPKLWKFERQADPNKHFVLKSVAPLKADAARKEMAERLQESPSKALLIFVHGYNMNFEAAALRTAQMAHDLRFPGMAFFYSWPSAGQVTGYWRDEETARLSEGVFEHLVEDLSHLPVTDIYIVAHSMGNRIVGHALQNRADKGKDTSQIRELLLAAPDINADIFRTIIAPRLAAMQGTHTTIYAASSDVALMVSKVVHGFKRVGDTRGEVFTYSGIETIDASSAASATRGYGHIYVVDSPPVMKDIRAIVERKGGAEARGLSAAGAAPNLYWRLPNAP